MVEGNSTDGPIRAVGFVVLEDDRHYFPPYEAVPLVRQDSLARHPGIQVAMDRLAGEGSAEEVRGMNYAVDCGARDVGDGAWEFRGGKGPYAYLDVWLQHEVGAALQRPWRGFMPGGRAAPA